MTSLIPRVVDNKIPVNVISLAVPCPVTREIAPKSPIVQVTSNKSFVPFCNIKHSSTTMQFERERIAKLMRRSPVKTASR